MVQIKYTCAAVPPDGISISCLYEFGKDEKGYYYKLNDTAVYMDIEIIKMLFSPVKGTWQDILKK